MAYNFQPLEQALDSLGFSYIDGVSVQIAAKYRVDCDLSEVRTILDKPAPSVLAFDSNYDNSYEKQVLQDLDKRSETEKTRAEERRKRIEEYELKKQQEIERRKKEEEEKALEDERKRLQELEDVKKAKLEAEQKLIEEERRLLEEESAKRQKEEEETAKKKKEEDEAEWKRFEEERSRRDSVSCDKSTEEEFRTPPQEPKTPEEINFTLQTPSANGESAPGPQPAPRPSGIIVKGVQNPEHNYTNINFSDFEATSDPFADLELKSINEMAELQSILGSVAMASSTHTPSQSQAPNNQNTYAPGSVYPPQHQAGPHPQYLPSSMTPSQALASRLAQSSYQPPGHGANFGYNYPGGYGGHQPPQPQQFYPQFYPTPVSSYQSQQVPSTQHQTAFIAHARNSPGPGLTNSIQNSLAAQDREQVTRSISSDRDRPHRTERLKDSVETEVAASSNGELKRVKSVGDMISELQREAEALNIHKKKSPTSRPTSRGATGLENWTPWPTLDQEPGSSSANGLQRTPTEARVDESCLASLRPEDAGLCRQLHEMGFPLPRLAKGISAVGADSQKLINFCLVVDRLVDEGFSIEACEDVSVLHNAEEDVCRKHLRSFQQIAEIGFPSKDVHQALIAASFDHQKALDQLIR